MFNRDRIGSIIQNEIENINKHLPSKRISLSKAIKGENNYTNREKISVHIDRSEIELLKELCPESKLNNVYLPLIVIRRRDLGEGTFTVGGDLIDQYLIFKVLNKFQGEWVEFLELGDKTKKMYLYKPELIVLRKKLPTATVIGFT